METRPVPRRWSRLLTRLAVAGLVSGVAGVAGFWGILRFAGREAAVEVPRFVGSSVETAREAAARADLVLEFVDERHDPEIPSGHVLEQEPAPGVEVRPGRRIRIVVSAGGEVVRLGRVVGRPDRQVEMELRQQGLAPGEVARVASRRAAAGTVLAQVPAPGSPAPVGTRVHRLVAAGSLPVRWVMPDLVGRPLAEVERWIEISGFRRGAIRRVAAARVPETIVGQLPPAGHPISSRGVIELTVAQ